MLDTYLRTFRRRAGLSQKEIAYLLGCRSGSRISRYEHNKSLPTLKTALGFGVIFQMPARELFAGLHHKVEKTISMRAGFLLRRLEAGGVEVRNAEKLNLLHKIIGR